MEGEDLQELVKKLLGVIKEQEARIAGLEAQIVELKATIARLQKDSRNYSKPPSSDIVKPKPEAQKTTTVSR
jgi:cell division protein FtsB